MLGLPAWPAQVQEICNTPIPCSLSPLVPECIDDFGFVWFEDEAVVAGSANWVLAGNAAAALTRPAQP